MSDLGQPFGWRPVVGYPGYYVSSDGKVQGKKCILKTTLRNRYPSVMPYGSDGPRRFGVHVLVLTAFVGPRPEGMQGMHKDDNPENNNLDNLAWGYVAENIATRNHARGEKQGSSKLKEIDIVKIRQLRSSHTLKDLAKLFGVSFSTIAHVVNGSSWSHV